jgi:predicted nucleic acid-binding protein
MFCLDTNAIVFALNKRRPEIDQRLQAELAAGTPLLVPTPVLFEKTREKNASDFERVFEGALDRASRLAKVLDTRRFEVSRDALAVPFGRKNGRKAAKR